MFVKSISSPSSLSETLGISHHLDNDEIVTNENEKLSEKKDIAASHKENDLLFSKVNGEEDLSIKPIQLHDPPIFPPSTSLTIPQEIALKLPTLSSSLHGFHCNRGELWLSEEEATSLGSLLLPLGFCFTAINNTSSNTVPAVPSKKRKSTTTAMPTMSSFSNTSSTNHQSMFSNTYTSELEIDPTISQLNDNLPLCQSADTVPKNIVCMDSITPITYDEDNVSSDINETSNVLNGITQTGIGLREKSTRRSSSNHTIANPQSTIPSTTSIPVDSKRRSRHQSVSETSNVIDVTSGPSITSDPIPQTSLIRSPKVISAPVRSSRRRRREMLTGNWWDACLEVTERLEKEPSSRWFLTPVDPEAESVPDYLEKVTCPMDLQTIRQKLTHGMYSHPFRWQEDVRTIFYNAFTYHEAGNLIWSDACFLASLFEQLCREHEGVNPYAVYGTHPLAKKPDRYGSPSRTGQSNVSTQSMTMSQSSESPLKSNVFGRSDTIVLEASKLRELLERAASVAQQGVLREGIGKDKWEGIGKWKGKDIGDVGSGKSGIRLDEQLSNATNRSPKTSGSTMNDTTLLSTLQISELPPPTLPTPPPPPLVTTMTPGDKVPNIIHRRLVSAQFRQLDVHLRKAALELVKDELGISPTIAACDPRFKVDLDVLPFLKQKQLLNYFRMLDIFQRKRIEEGYTVTLVTALNIPSPMPTLQQESSSQLPSPSTSPVRQPTHAAYQSSTPTVQSLIKGTGQTHSEGTHDPLGSHIRPSKSISSVKTSTFTPISSYGTTTQQMTSHTQSVSTQERHPSSSSSSSGSSSSSEDDTTSSEDSDDNDEDKSHKESLKLDIVNREQSITSNVTLTNQQIIIQKHSRVESLHKNTELISTEDGLSVHKVQGSKNSDQIQTDIITSRNIPLTQCVISSTPSVLSHQNNKHISGVPTSSSSEDEEDDPHSDISNTSPLNNCYGKETIQHHLSSSGPLLNTTVDELNIIKQKVAPLIPTSSIELDSVLPPIVNPSDQIITTPLDNGYGYSACDTSPSSSSSSSSSNITTDDDDDDDDDNEFHSTNQVPQINTLYTPECTISSTKENGLRQNHVNYSLSSMIDGPAQIESNILSTPSSLIRSAEVSRESGIILPLQPKLHSTHFTEQILENEPLPEDTFVSSPLDDCPWGEGVSSSWGEWKAKVIQHKIQLRIGNEENQALLSSGDTEGERAAELADAEI